MARNVYSEPREIAPIRLRLYNHQINDFSVIKLSKPLICGKHTFLSLSLFPPSQTKTFYRLTNLIDFILKNKDIGAEKGCLLKGHKKCIG
jgi:hypothetical protein